MKFLETPLEIWLAAIAAVFIKLQTRKGRLTVIGAVTTTLVAVISGVYLTDPIMTLLGIGVGYKVLMTIIVALSAENLMIAVVDLSNDTEWVKSFLRTWISAKSNTELDAYQTKSLQRKRRTKSSSVSPAHSQDTANGSGSDITPIDPGLTEK